MENIISQTAELLMYEGTPMKELMITAKESGKDFNLKNRNGISILEITSDEAYGLKVTDRYYYDTEGKLIKQEIMMNKRVKVIFDKYKEVTELLTNLEGQMELVS